ncbi:hypothetical protein B0H14DRAFT_3491588 [Mycena olivaceomarginata]|nr:hypothetical protein B0H14DRAFT_3491588 [Mycena olivaceomarginata]
MPENQAVKKLIAWATAVVPLSTLVFAFHALRPMKILILLILLMVLCTPPCPRTFARERELKIHQKACDIFKNAQRLGDKRAMEGESALELMKWKRKKKDEQNQPAVPAEPEQSTSGSALQQEPPPDIEIDLLDRPPSPEPPRLPTPPPQTTVAGRPIRNKRKTWKLLQQLPDPIQPPLVQEDPPQEPTPAPPSELIPTWVWNGIQTTVNGFGLFHEYPSIPTYNPDEMLSTEEMADYPGGTRANTATIPSQLTPFEPDTSSAPDPADSDPGSDPDSPTTSVFTGPFSNWSIFALMNWQWTGSATKLIAEMKRLLGILKDKKYSPEDVMDFDIKRETAVFGNYLANNANNANGKQHASEADAPVFEVPGLFYQPLVEQFWSPSPGSPPQRIYDEIYSSDAMVEAHTALQNQPWEPGCTLERVVLTLMAWSDSTHLASFGDASLWPFNVCHHVAYFPKLPDTFHDYFQKLTGSAPSADFLTHCRRELMHAIWRLLLDDEFLKAYEHGIVINVKMGCCSAFTLGFSRTRPIILRILLATIRNLGKAPCPRCYLPKEKIEDLGTARDEKKRETLARTDEHVCNGTIRRIQDWIYTRGRTVTSSTFDFFLLARSWTPTSNVFSDKLSKFNFNPFKMLIPDFMHEFELGVFKAFFIHLLCILHAEDGSCISSLNKRFRMIPTFGRSTIRCFTLNTSALKKLAAWNYQSMLLCAIPVVEDLLPEPYNSDILDLLFILAEWHSLAKLKLHTDGTIPLLGTATKEVGRLLRRFKRVTYTRWNTKELPSEAAARGCRQAKKAANSGKGKARANTAPNKKEFSLSMYKLHSLGDYYGSARLTHTRLNRQVEMGELEHRRVKRFYARTNKNQAVRQITLLEQCETVLMCIAARAQKKACRTFVRTTPTLVAQGHKHKLGKSQMYVPFNEHEALPYTMPEQHHHISSSRNFSLHVSSWLTKHADDPVTKNFLPKLQEHLLSCLSHPEWSGDGNEFTAGERFKLAIKNHRIYCHKILRVNYTSYDVRTGQDCLNPRTHSDIMYLAPDGDESHPFSYAQIIGIFHADVVNTAPGANPKPESMEFLWIRRYKLDRTWRGRFKKKQLFRLEFLPEADPDAFGFLNPDEVIRGTHIIPAFACGTTEDLLSSGSIGCLPRPELTDDQDWQYYYVNFFVDRDMYMRYRGRGIGHYQVPIPPEEDIPDSMPDDNQDNNPELAIPIPEVIPPPLATPPGMQEFPAYLELPDTRPDSPNSENGDSDSNDSSSDEEDLDDNDKEVEEPDLGPEDGLGHVDEEVEEGYAVL